MNRVNNRPPSVAISTPLRGQRSPERTRRNILTAATAEFAAHGLAGARIDAIARRAGSNKRMIYEYFGNKEELWLAVLEYIYGAIRNAETKIDIERFAPAEAMRRLVAFTFRHHMRHPEFLALVNTENLNHARYLRRSRGIKDMHSPLLRMLDRLLKRGAKAGVFRRGVDPMQLYITMAALGYFYFSNRYTLSAIFGHDLDSATARRKRERHVVDVIMGFLQTGRTRRRDGRR